MFCNIIMDEKFHCSIIINSIGLIMFNIKIMRLLGFLGFSSFFFGIIRTIGFIILLFIFFGLEKSLKFFFSYCDPSNS